MTSTERTRWLMCIAVALAVSLLVLVAVRPAQAAFPGQNGKIAFERGFKVWMKKPSLAAPENKLRDETSQDLQPAFSPDGSRVAFVRQSEIYVARADGTGTPTKLTTDCLLDRDPAWSHDGTRIVFVRRSNGADPTSCNGQYNIWTMNADGTDQTQITTDGLNTDPAWSVPLPGADDGRIVYRHASAELWTMAPGGTDKTRLTFSCPNENGGICDTSIGIPTFSPDGTRVAFDYSGDIYWTFTAGGGNATPILRGANPNEEYPGDEGEAAWSPDGTKIAFKHNDVGGNSFYDIYTANADGSSTQATQITSTGGVNPDWQPNNAPAITMVRPVADSETRDRTPTIAATVSDKQTDLTKANITLSLDGNGISRKAFSYDAATDRLSYTPTGELSFGRHTAQIVARDEMGLRTTEIWSFKVVR